MTARIFRKLVLTNLAASSKKLHTTILSSSVYEKDRKAGYPIKYDKPPPQENLHFFGKIRNGYHLFKHEFGIFMKEVKEFWERDPILICRPNEVDIVWQFKNDPKALDQWVVTCDSDYNEGYSTAKLDLSSIGTGIFSGILNTRLPKDGKINYAGYCNICTIPIYKSFKREICHDWTNYTHLILRIRGDGRSYSLNLSTRGIFDLTWNDMYQYALYTRGGPYWQYVKIPFSKFVFTSKGRVQDSQIPVQLHEIRNLSITLGDDITGHFRLEIDYIGLERDDYCKEEFAYETYDVSHLRF